MTRQYNTFTVQETYPSVKTMTVLNPQLVEGFDLSNKISIADGMAVSVFKANDRFFYVVKTHTGLRLLHEFNGMTMISDGGLYPVFMDKEVKVGNQIRVAILSEWPNTEMTRRMAGEANWTMTGLYY